MNRYIEYAKNVIYGCSEAFNGLKIAMSKSFSGDRMAADLIRYTHSIEKGLSICNPRLGFGHAKQKEMLTWIHELKHSDENYHRQAVDMAISALNAYVAYHDMHDYTDDFIEKIRSEVVGFCDKGHVLSAEGGVKEYKKEERMFDTAEIERFFETRHSIRDFDKKPIDYRIVEKAIHLAQTCPSACNRQAVRVYVYSFEKAENIRKWLTGIGGFENEIGAFMIVTGKQSAYKQNERYQYIVSASMFTAYLTLSLHAYGMGACVVQRPVVANGAWKSLRKKLNIPLDEQAICVLGIGNLKDTCKVPISHRLSGETIARYEI